MRYVFIMLWMLIMSTTSAVAQVSIGIGLPGVSIGINLPLYPELVRVPGYPVYYAPRLNSNFFFYDGMYWVYQRDNWYASSWYNGPWGFVAPEMVPVFVLRIPVRYYRNPPEYFRGWRPDAPPRWGDHWGNDWQQHRSGWDRWNRGSAPAPAPLPVYQRKYSGERYPEVEQQRDIHNQNYRYQPRDTLVRQHDQAPTMQRPAERVPTAPAPARQDRQVAPQERTQRPQDSQRSTSPPPLQQSAPVTTPRSQLPQRGSEEVQRAVPAQAPARQQAPVTQERPARQGAAPHEQQAPASSQDNNRRERGVPQQDTGRGQGQERERESGEGRGQGRNK